MTQMKPLSSYSLTMVGKTFSSLLASDLRSKGFSVARIWVMVLPLRKILLAGWFVSSLASERQRLMLSGFTPIRVPVQIFPIVVVT